MILTINKEKDIADSWELDLSKEIGKDLSDQEFQFPEFTKNDQKWGKNRVD